MRLSVPASEAFPDPCCYLIRLEAVKRHVIGSDFGACGYTCNYDQYYNIDEFTVGAGVCDPPRKVGVASMPVPEAG
jgi:hypothetical protein